jgi:hypothetical protein
VFGDSIRFFGPPTKIKLTLDGCVLLLFFVIISNKKQSQDNESSIRGNQDYDAEGSGSLVASVQNRLINKL